RADVCVHQTRRTLGLAPAHRLVDASVRRLLLRKPLQIYALFLTALACRAQCIDAVEQDHVAEGFERIPDEGIARNLDDEIVKSAVQLEDLFKIAFRDGTLV